MRSLNGRRIGLAILMAAMLAAGLSTGVRMYYVVFALLAGMLALGVVSALWTLWTLRFDMKGVKARVSRGENMMCVFTVRHGCPVPVSAITVQLNVPAAYAAGREINVVTPPFAARNYRQVIECPHRGIYEAGVTRLSVTDMFALVRFTRRSDVKLMRVEVMPRVTQEQPMALGSVDLGPEMRSRAAEDNASPSDVRAWQEGDELKKVHWKLSLRKREMMVRTYEESARPDTLIIPDLGAITELKDQQLTMEDAVCEAALGTAKAQLEAGYPVRMPLVAAHPSEIAGQFPADYPAFAEALLRVRFDSPYGYEQVLMQMLTRLQRTGGAVLITARLTTRVADLALRMARSGMATRLIWVSDDARDSSMEMLERLKMGGVQAARRDPWDDDKPARRSAARAEAADAYDAL